ncbi:MAG: cache domain-containing protein [Promethearchaeota archaeon]
MKNKYITKRDQKSGIKIGIRKKILLIFSGFSLLALLLVSGIIGIFFGVVNNTTTAESQAALTTQIQTNLITSADENALTIDEKLNSAINDVKALADFAENLFNNPDIYGEYPSYNDTDYTIVEWEQGVPGYGQEFISFDHSMYHLAEDVYNSSYLDADPEILNYINISANLDHIFKYTKAANPDFGWIYMGFDVGLFRCYPWSMFDQDYDPRTRSWYDFDGLSSNDVLITTPYVDANGLGLMITISKQVFTTTDDLIGIIAADLTIDKLQESILDIEFLGTGYAFMIDNDGLAIAHSDLVEPDPDEELTTLISELENIPTSIIDEITAGGSGFSIFEKEVNATMEYYYLAYSPIGDTDYIVVTLVPEDEALLSVSQLEENIRIVNARNTITLIIVIAVAGALSVGLGTILAGQITKPVKALTDAVKRLTKQDAIAAIVQSDSDILIDPALESQDDEIGDLTRAFKNMLTSIKNERQNLEK